jgi:hypothetical protein
MGCAAMGCGTSDDRACQQRRFLESAGPPRRAARRPTSRLAPARAARAVATPALPTNDPRRRPIGYGRRWWCAGRGLPLLHDEKVHFTLFLVANASQVEAGCAHLGPGAHRLPLDVDRIRRPSCASRPATGARRRPACVRWSWDQFRWISEIVMTFSELGLRLPPAHFKPHPREGDRVSHQVGFSRSREQT